MGLTVHDETEVHLLQQQQVLELFCTASSAHWHHDVLCPRWSILLHLRRGILFTTRPNSIEIDDILLHEYVFGGGRLRFVHRGICHVSCGTSSIWDC